MSLWGSSPTTCVCALNRTSHALPLRRCWPRGRRPGTSAPLQVQITLFRSLICTGARLNTATCGANHSNRERRSAPGLRLGTSAPLQVPSAHQPQTGSRSSFPVALICTTCRPIPASSGTHQGPEKGDLVPKPLTLTPNPHPPTPDPRPPTPNLQPPTPNRRRRLANPDAGALSSTPGTRLVQVPNSTSNQVERLQEGGGG